MKSRYAVWGLGLQFLESFSAVFDGNRIQELLDQFPVMYLPVLSVYDIFS